MPPEQKSPFYKERRNAAFLSLGFGIGMLVLKMGAYIITGSAAIFSDALESVVHILATIMALTSIIIGARPADKSHPFGHGNIEFFSAGTEGVLIVVAAIAIIYTSIPALLRSSEIPNLDIGIIAVAAAGVINFFLGYYLIRKGKTTKSLTLVADGKHVLTDSYTSIGVLVGIILVKFTGLTILDPIFAIFVAMNILYTGYGLVRQSIGGLMKEADPKLLAVIGKHLNACRTSYWIEVHELRFWKSGDLLFVEFHLILPYYFTIQQTHAEEDKIKDELEKEFPNVHLKVHLDYCIPALCKWCTYEPCDKRTEPHSVPVSFADEKLIDLPIFELKQ